MEREKLIFQDLTPLLPEQKAYALLVTFQKTEKEFSPSTMYADYPISRELLHWESQANTAQHHADGQNLIHHQERGYTVLVFARGQKKRNNVTVPFTYLGPVDRGSVTRASGRSRWFGGSGMRCRWRCLRIIEGVGNISVMMSYEQSVQDLTF